MNRRYSLTLVFNGGTHQEVVGVTEGNSSTRSYSGHETGVDSFMIRPL
jgi:hypothetical protein